MNHSSLRISRNPFASLSAFQNRQWAAVADEGTTHCCFPYNHFDCSLSFRSLFHKHAFLPACCWTRQSGCCCCYFRNVLLLLLTLAARHWQIYSYHRIIYRFIFAYIPCFNNPLFSATTLNYKKTWILLMVCFSTLCYVVLCLIFLCQDAAMLLLFLSSVHPLHKMIDSLSKLPLFTYILTRRVDIFFYWSLLDEPIFPLVINPYFIDKFSTPFLWLLSARFSFKLF